MVDQTSKRMTTELGDSVAEQIVFMEAWLDAWKGDPISQGAARMARKVIATLKSANETQTVAVNPDLSDLQLEATRRKYSLASERHDHWVQLALIELQERRAAERSAVETSVDANTLAQLRRIDKAARAFVDSRPGKAAGKAYEALSNALFDGRPVETTAQETVDRLVSERIAGATSRPFPEKASGDPKLGDPCPVCANGRIGQSGTFLRCANCGWTRDPTLHTKGE